MKPLRLIACLLALATPLCAHSQYATYGGPAYRAMPSVARPGPGEPGCKKPEYPLAALRQNEEGVVTMRYLIDKDGAILDGKIVKSSGSYELDKAALVGLAKCKWTPREGMQEPAWVAAQYVWKLE